MIKNTLKTLREKYSSPGIYEIKLKDLLTLRNNEDINKKIHTMYPPIEIGSITLVDQIVLLCLEEIIQPKNIIEIGTYLGYTTRLLLENSTAEKITSIDLPKDANSDLKIIDYKRTLTDGDYNDEYLVDNQNKTGEIYLNDISQSNRKRLNLVKQDSTKINFLDKFKSANYVFIDGGHSYDIIKSDTMNSQDIVKEGVIIWHDYNSNIHSDVTRFIESYSNENIIFNVKGSLCAFQFFSD